MERNSYKIGFFFQKIKKSRKRSGRMFQGKQQLKVEIWVLRVQR